jgi:hypothetical protein
MSNMINKTNKLLEQSVNIIESEIEKIQNISDMSLLENSQVGAINAYVKSLLAINKEWKEDAGHQLEALSAMDMEELKSQFKKAIKSLEKKDE